jgi:hypothetical protein
MNRFQGGAALPQLERSGKATIVNVACIEACQMRHVSADKTYFFIHQHLDVRLKVISVRKD